MAHTLLVADESVTIQRVVDLLFAAQGIKVVAVSDGEQALDYLRSARPDVALISAKLQKVDGFEVARFAQGQPALQRVPVLLMAGAFDSVDEDRVHEVGAAGVVFKPFEAGHVISRVKELLGLVRPEQVARASPVTEPLPPPTHGDGADLHFEESSTEGARTHQGRTETSSATGASGAAGASLAPAPIAPPAQVSPLAPGTFAPAFAPVPPVSAFGPADAFAVLLAAEQGEAVGPVLPQPVVELSDGMVERIADRVADRLIHSAFGDSLRGTVQDVSERLVREEIQRIRAAAHRER
jgi:DNA-binding response OmpR family regulator